MNLSRSKPALIEIASDDIAEIRIDPAKNHRSLFSRREFSENEIISDFGSRRTYSKPSYLTIQISDSKHIELYYYSGNHWVGILIYS